MSISEAFWPEDPLPVNLRGLPTVLDLTEWFPACVPGEHWWFPLKKGEVCRRCGMERQPRLSGNVVTFRR